MTRPYAEVIGDPIAHSKSPLIHNFWLAKLGIDAEYRACRLAFPEHLEYLNQARDDPNWLGCNITMPWKSWAACRAEMVDAAVFTSRAANTLVRDGDRLVAYNTDVIGVAEALSNHAKPSYRNHVATYAHIIGAGGAAPAAALGFARAGYSSLDIYFYNRTVEKARALAEQLPGNADFGMPLDSFGGTNLPENGDQRYSAVVINASPMGMNDSPPLQVSLESFHLDTIVFDMVYSPLETPLLVEARQRGMRTIDGLEMLVGQAAAAFELFFGQVAPREHDAELRALLTS